MSAHTSRSLEEVHRSVSVSHHRWWRRMLAFAGPAYMVSVGYMDPGNWATDLEGGARFGYQLIWVLLMSNIMAVLLQTLSARLGVVTGRDLAQACRDDYSPSVRWILFVLCEIAIAACDLAEVLGTAIGLNLLFGIPLIWAVVITAGDVMILLAIQRLGIRKMEAFILMLVTVIGICFIVEIFLSEPSVSGIASGFVPQVLSGPQLYIAIGILGATVMPHNLYLHSALVQSRDVPRDVDGVRKACRFNLIDSAVALNAAFFVNAAILIVAAATFHTRGIEVTEIQQAHRLLEDLLGSRLAPAAFAIALIAAGQSSTLTGTLAGQITMEGFLQIKMRPWLRRLMTRSMAVIPAVLVIAISGEGSTYKLLILSQVVLSLQLSFAVVPLIKFTSSKRKMGPFVSPRWVQISAWLVAGIIMALNGKLVLEEILNYADAAGSYGWLVLWTATPLSIALGLLLVWMIFKPSGEVIEPTRPGVAAKVAASVQLALEEAPAPTPPPKHRRRIGVAVEAKPTDAPMLTQALNLARVENAELLLMHVVEGVGGQWHGPQSADEERREDDRYLTELAEHLQAMLSGSQVTVRTVLGFGSVPRELIRLAREHEVDLMVLGGHGHRKLADIFKGDTITHVRHGLKVPVLAVRGVDKE